VLVGRDDEKARVEAELLDAAPERGLRVARELVRVEENNGLEHAVQVHVCFCEIFDVFSNEFDALLKSAVHANHVVVYFVGVNFVQEALHQRPFPAAVRPVKNEVGNLVQVSIIFQTGFNTH
jgi:hypothetical protein